MYSVRMDTDFSKKKAATTSILTSLMIKKSIRKRRADVRQRLTDLGPKVWCWREVVDLFIY